MRKLSVTIKRLLCLLAIWMGLSVFGILPVQADVKALEESFTRIADTVGPAVVTISMERVSKVMVFGPGQYYLKKSEKDKQLSGQDPFEQFFKNYFGNLPEGEFRQQGLGSGVIIDKKGYVLTNQHVIENADKIKVTLPDGRSYEAKILGEDRRNDLAILKIDGEDLPYAELGDSDSVKTGQWAVAIGNPFGHIVRSSTPTLTVGVISALHRSLPIVSQAMDRSYINLIQTDAAINPGNSGGPLCNLDGKIIGINVAIFSQTGGNIGMSFAIPVNTVKNILDDLISGKKVTYGWLGIAVHDMTQDMADRLGLQRCKGAIVASVLADGPAAKGGIKQGDVIEKYNDIELRDTEDLLDKINRSKVGEKVVLDILRDKKRKRVAVIVTEKPGKEGG